MGEINENSEDTRSKIEKIREDLERKLAALEAAKKRTTQYKESEKSEIEEQQLDKSEELIVEPDSIITPENETIDTNLTINENIELNLETKEVKEEQSLLFEITDTIQPVEDTGLKEPEETPQENISIANETQNKESITIGLANKDEVIETVEEAETTESKKTKLNYLIYSLAGLLFILLAYFSYDYFRDNKRLKQNKIDLMISKYKNRSYLDSIELADAQNQLLDFRSQTFLDSIADVNFADLESQLKNDSNKSKNKPKKKKTIQTPIKISKVSDSKNNSTSQVSNESINNSKNEDESNNPDIDIASNENNNESESSVENTTIEDEPETNKTNDSSTNDTEKEKNETAPKTDTKITKPAVRKVAVYPGCEKRRTESDKKKCLLSKMSRHVSRNFNTDLAQDLGLKEGVNKIRVSFIIDKNGNTKVLNVRTPDKRLEKEAIRVVKSMPKMTPAKIDGVSKAVKYNIPILFNVEN